MKLITLLLLFLSFPSYAQEFTETPLCFIVKNEAPYMVYGEISTDYEEIDGQKMRHTGSFRLAKKGAEHKDGYMLDRSEFCSKGPFYEGRQVELTIRTLIPVFSCKTNIELGEIVIKGEIREDGTTKSWATCY